MPGLIPYTLCIYFSFLALNEHDNDVTALTSSNNEKKIVVEMEMPNNNAYEYATVNVKDENKLIVDEDPTYMDMNTLEEPLYSNTQVPAMFDPHIPSTIPIPISDFGAHIANSHYNGDSEFQEQYQVKDLKSRLCL